MKFLLVTESKGSGVAGGQVYLNPAHILKIKQLGTGSVITFSIGDGQTMTMMADESTSVLIPRLS